MCGEQKPRALHCYTERSKCVQSRNYSNSKRKSCYNKTNSQIGYETAFEIKKQVGQNRHI